MNFFTDRNVQVIKVEGFGEEYLHPENLLIQFDKNVKSLPFDIGALCYKRREIIRQGFRGGAILSGRKVDVSSLDRKRRELVLRLLDVLSVSGQRQTSMYKIITEVKYFVEWVDNNGHDRFAEDCQSFVAAYSAYSNSLYDRILGKKDLSPATARRFQSTSRMLLRVMYPEDHAGLISRVPTISGQRKPSAAPENKVVESFLKPLVPFVRNLRAALMNSDFPLTVNCGAYDVTLLPCNARHTISPYVSASDIHSLFDAANNRLYKLDELGFLGPVWKIERDYLRAISNIAAHNIDKKGALYRRKLAQKVIRGYALLIQALTGINSSDLVCMKTSSNLDVSTDSVKKDLVSVKFRAAGKLVSYPIGGRQGLKLLREYMDFREWYLNGRKCEFLFFQDIDSRGVVTSPAVLKIDFQRKLFSQLSGSVLDPDIKSVTPTQMRKHKSIVLKKIGLRASESATALNHGIQTSEDYYDTPSTDDMKIELGEYWNAVKLSVRTIQVRLPGDTESRSTIVGHCDEIGEPMPAEAFVPIEPNCGTQYGCLYCVHYACHADEEDIRKLFCLKYVMDAVRNGADEIERAEQLFKDICIRVEALVKKIAELYPETSEVIARVRKEVFELGILTPFWESRLSRYEEMGVVL
ncbi:hypothetical protein AB4876_05375 [Zhongshania guokunii]|uniref:Phage integrase family protein n=1 Tax=Zhongshania guokunii TaxID=641783 RepID=A0ABV3U338_9GAMM